MRRLSVLSLVILPLLSLGGSSGCRPSKAELAAVTAELQQVRAEQAELKARLAQLEESESESQAQAEDYRNLIAGGLKDLWQRVVALEEKEAKKPAPTPRPDPLAVYRVEVGDSHAKGPDDALVTIVMWTDYQCPYCARVQVTLAEVETRYGRDVRFVHKHNPLGFHPNAMPAAIAVEAAARQGKFWPMHELLFENGKDLSDATYRRLAKKLRLKLGRFDQDRKDPALRERIEAEQQQGIRLGARGTPAFFINGRFLSGAQPLANFEQLVDEELAKARTLVSRGVPRAEVYQVTIAEGRTKP